MSWITVKKTHELTALEWDAIAEGFNEEFKKAKTAADLIKYYKANVCGYSYHGIAKNDTGIVAGFSSIVPVQYTDASGAVFLTGLSGGTFVKAAFRSDIFIFHDIYKALRKSCIEDGFTAVLGVPNKNSYKYLVKLLGFKFLYNLPYYVLPVSVSGILSRKLPKPVNAVYFVFVWLYSKLVHFFSYLFNPAEKKSAFTISFSPEISRLRFNEQYTTVADKQSSFTYRVYNERNLNIAYLFQFTQNGQRHLKALSKAVNHIIGKEKVDLVIFVGKLDMLQCLLLKIPVKKEPQQLPLTIDILLPGTDGRYALLKDPANWNFGLMNFDVR